MEQNLPDVVEDLSRTTEWEYQALTSKEEDDLQTLISQVHVTKGSNLLCLWLISSSKTEVEFTICVLTFLAFSCYFNKQTLVFLTHVHCPSTPTRAQSCYYCCLGGKHYDKDVPKKAPGGCVLVIWYVFHHKVSIGILFSGHSTKTLKNRIKSIYWLINTKKCTLFTP